MAVKSALEEYGRQLRPASIAFSLALLSTAGPRSLSVLIALLRRKRNWEDSVNAWIKTLKVSTQLNNFPVFCGILIGGSTFLAIPIQKILSSVIKDTFRLRVLSRFVAALISASYSFSLLNRPDPEPSTSSRVEITDDPKLIPTSSTRPRAHRSRSLTNHHHPLIPLSIPPLPPGIETPVPTTTPQAGTTIDLTLFTLVRAIDALFALAPPPSRVSRPRARKLYDVASSWSAPVLFVASCYSIMYAFFYAPLTLPGTYVRWIGRIAGVDPRLVHALRQVKFGSWKYGEETGMAPLLKGMCNDLHVPEDWADPAKTVPVPCYLVHHGMGGSSCEAHAIQRWLRSWIVSAGVYAPLSAILLMRRIPREKDPKRRRQVFMQITKGAARSSAFLATFVSSFYLGVCLARRRIGPKVLPQITPGQWDSGLCIQAGCLLCGWSVLVETPKRQIELMLFVLPRALATITGRRYDANKRWIEHLVFGLSAAVVLTAAKENKETVRGVLGAVLNMVFGQ